MSDLLAARTGLPFSLHARGPDLRGGQRGEPGCAWAPWPPARVSGAEDSSESPLHREIH